jgi:hypothetical protein
MEIFIQGAVENMGDPHANSLQTLVDESGAVFDILTHMFTHKNDQIQRAGKEALGVVLRISLLHELVDGRRRWSVEVTLLHSIQGQPYSHSPACGTACPAALEVYVRRAYRAYAIQNISHDMTCPDYRVIEWRFLLPSAHPNSQFAGFGKVYSPVRFERGTRAATQHGAGFHEFAPLVLRLALVANGVTHPDGYFARLYVEPGRDAGRGAVVGGHEAGAERLGPMRSDGQDVPQPELLSCRRHGNLPDPGGLRAGTEHV